MPQMPTGPGAPSDVGPDGGLTDPGMVGPDGMPPDEGMPPDGEEDPDDGGFPPGGDGDEPPPDDDEDDGPPPPKSKKKASRRYLGLEGQVLDEDQFLRHVAVRVSGADPRVLARMRRISAARSEKEKADRGHYQRGWRASERASEWDGEGQSALEKADWKNEPRQWYDGYHDYAADRPKFHALECPTDGDHDQPGCSLYGKTAARRRPGRTAVRIEHNHEDMSEEHLRHHMNFGHGYRDSPDDPDWLVDQTHRDEHADAPMDHVHPDLEHEHDLDTHLGDRDWMHQNGIEASYRRDRWQ
jgi:hypothetical protein